MSWEGKVTVTARLTVGYEFNGEFPVKDEQEAKNRAREFFKEDVIELAYQDPEAFARSFLETWLGDDITCENVA